MSAPREHALKTNPDYFDAVERGDKTFEVRVNDRGFQTGDLIHLRRTERDNYRKVCMDHQCTECRAEWLTKRITYIFAGDATLRDGGGIVPGHVVLGLGAVSDD